jgi:Zn-finger nucleic acid-binding protein
MKTEARTIQTRHHDDRQRSEVRPGESRSRIDCPCCEKPLVSRTLEGITIDACSDCGGIWLEAGEMPALVQRGPRILHPLTHEMGRPVGNVELALETGHSLLCPHCNILMEGGPYSYNLKARVDHCSRCGGAWVGAGELASIVGHHAVARARLQAPRPLVAAFIAV